MMKEGIGGVDIDFIFGMREPESAVSSAGCRTGGVQGNSYSRSEVTPAVKYSAASPWYESCLKLMSKENIELW